MKYVISHVTTCNSQYFSYNFNGHHLPVVQVLVDENTTYRDIKEALLDYQTYEHLFDDTRFGDENVSSDDGFDGDTYKAAVEELFANFTTLDYVPDMLCELGYMDEFEDLDCYMYLVVEPVEN